jgi:hypothetical protein
LSIPRIFVSYRRGDSGHAGRLYDALTSRFGSDNVFMDIDTIDPGVDFAEVINRAVTSCDAVIALIGRGWIAANDPKGRRRLEEPDDFVRLELESALAQDIVVIPTCVQGAQIPAAHELPPSLAPLARRQGIELRDVGWHDDVGRLIRRLERLAEKGRQDVRAHPPSQPPTAEPTPRSWRSKRVLVPVGVVVTLGIAAVVAALALRGSGDGRTSGAEGRLLAFIPPVTRPSCERISYGERSAQASLSCSGARLSVTYHLFSSNDDMNAWYAQKRELEKIQPGAGTCTGTTFRGERRYSVGGRTVGSYFCFVDSEGESELVWTDGRVNVGSEANIYEGTGRAAAESLLRQWQCCLKLQP